MILVVGATGLVGGRAALALREQGHPVRAMVRGGAARAEAAPLARAGAEIVDADLRRPETLSAACSGARAVICTATTMPHGADDGLRRVDLDGVLSLIEASERAGVGRFVYTSFSGTLTTPSPLTHAKRTCEQRLRDGTMISIILRPTCFMEVWLSPVVGFEPANGRVRIYGTGKEGITFMSALDVGEFAAAAAVRPDATSEVLELGGPETISLREVVRRYETFRGADVSLEVVPLAALEEGYRAAVDPIQKTFAALMIGYARGDRIPDADRNAERFGVRLRSVDEVLSLE